MFCLLGNTLGVIGKISLNLSSSLNASKDLCVIEDIFSHPGEMPTLAKAQTKFPES